MVKVVLAELVALGLSQTEIGRRLGRHQSTVSYWCAKHGVEPPRHHAGPRGAISRERYILLIQRNLTTREIAAELDRSPTTVTYWLRRYGLKTTAEARRHAAAKAAAREVMTGVCAVHGESNHIVRAGGASTCVKCRAGRVSEWRREAKRRLVARAGGACAACGYDRHVGALHFHHRVPSEKVFALGGRGLSRPWAALIAEADKCVLLCANCHAEVEGGIAILR